MELSTRDGEDFTKANLLLAKFYVDKVCFSFFDTILYGSKVDGSIRFVFLFW